MTQPEQAVGGSNDAPIIAAEPTLEDRFAALSDEKLPEEEETPPETEGETELTPEDVTDEPEADEPPIQPPVSWKDEEKEEFKNLPRALQETLTRREAEREKFVQSKAHEAKTARSEAEREALGAIEQIKTTHAEQLRAFLPQIPAKPSHHLSYEDPEAYARQMDAHDYAVAQYQYVQQQIETFEGQARQAAQARQQHGQQALVATLQEKFPEFVDPTTGPKLQQELTSIALELGYTQEQMPHADADDILAMKKASEWKAKADKFDTLMAKKMERVREAKGLPKVSRPGAAQPRGAAENQRYTADRQAMKGGDRDATARVFSRFL